MNFLNWRAEKKWKMKRLSNLSYLGLIILFLLLLEGCAQIPGTDQVSQVANGARSMTFFEFVSQTVFYVLCIAFVYFFLVTKPRVDQEQRQTKFLATLKKNDDVVTSGGIFGKVVNVKPDSVTVEISTNVRIRVRGEDVFPVSTKEPKQESNKEGASANSNS